MINPNYIYSVAFLFVMAIYQLRWSDLYPTLNSAILTLLFVTILVNLLIGHFSSKMNLTKSRIEELSKMNLPRLILFTLFLLLLWTIDKAFGDIPTFHIVLVTFTSFYNCYIFSRYLIEKKTTQFFVFIILFLTTAILSTYRILIFFNLITCLLTYIYIKNPFKSTIGKILVGISLIGLFYVFGVMGNNFKGHETGKVILVIGGATDEFKSSFVPDEYFWIYLYASSPLANLELNISANNSIQPSMRGYFVWGISEFLPDFISKKIFPLLGEKQLDGIQVNSALNVSTVYLRSFRYASWFGLTIMALFIAVFPIIYLYLIRNSKYFIIGLVSISTLYMFLVFDNIFAFSPLSFQLVYPFFGIYRITNRSTDDNQSYEKK